MTDTPDVHVDWHMTHQEWEQLRGILLRNTGYVYIGRLEASGALGTGAPACRVCDGSGTLTVPDGDGESASEQECPDPIHDRQAAAPELAEPVTVAGVLCSDYPSVVAAMQAEIDRERTTRLHLAGERDVALATARQLHEFAWTLSDKLGHRERLNTIFNRAVAASTVPQSAPEMALMEAEAAQVRSAMAEITRIHDELLEEILKNADEDINGGDEAAEYLAEHYVRWLETERDRASEKLDAAEQEVIDVRACAVNAFAIIAVLARDNPAAQRQANDLRKRIGMLPSPPEAELAEPQPAPELAQAHADLREARHASRTHRERLRQLLADTPFEFKPDWASEYEEIRVPQHAPELADGTPRIRVTAFDFGTGESNSVVIEDDYVLICAGTCHRYYVEDRFDGTHVITVKGRKQGQRNVAEPQAAPERIVVSVGDGSAIGKLAGYVMGEQPAAGDLLDEILRNAPDGYEGDISETPEDVAVRYVRWLESDRDRLIAIVREREPLSVKPSDDVKPAPELAAAMAETGKVRAVARELLGMFHGISGGYGARTSIGRLTRLARQAGIEPPQPGDPLSAVLAAEHDQLDQLREQLAARTTLLATVLSEFKLGSDGCHARMSQVTLAKRKLAAGMEITDDERRMIGA